MVLRRAKKRFFSQRSAGTFEEPLKVQGRTCKGSSRRGRTFKGGCLELFKGFSRALAEEPFLVLLRTIFSKSVHCVI